MFDQLRFPDEIAKEVAAREKAFRKSKKLTPAYDLTYSNSIGGEHATCVNGNGRDPGREDLLTVGRRAGLASGWLRKTTLEIEEIAAEDLDDILGRHI